MSVYLYANHNTIARWEGGSLGSAKPYLSSITSLHSCAPRNPLNATSPNSDREAHLAAIAIATHHAVPLTSATVRGQPTSG